MNIMSKWEEKWDARFKMSLLPLLPMIPNRNIPYEMKKFISDLLEEQEIKHIAKLAAVHSNYEQLKLSNISEKWNY